MNRSDIEGLRRAFAGRDLVLFLGAGVSMPYGVPSWKNLVLELLFDQAERTRRLGDMWPHYRRALASWMTDYFDYNPLVLARIVEHEFRPMGHNRRRKVRGDSRLFLERLRAHLYAGYHRPPERTALDAVADLVTEEASGGIAAVVTFNFDDLLERKLEERGARWSGVVSGSRQSGNELHVVHAHGFVPKGGEIAREHLVFTEPDYHNLTETSFHWALSEVVERLRKNTVLFVGLSMSDPSLRRLLDASRNSDIPAHWQIQKRHEVRDHELTLVERDVQERARKYAKLLGKHFEQTKPPHQLREAIQDALRQADSYDRMVFESMGVKTVWVDEFEHVATVLDAIRS
jgi:hypothetical protein